MRAGFTGSDQKKTKRFSGREAVRFGWDRLKSHLVFFLTVMVIKGLIDRAPDIVEKMVGRVDPAPFLPNEMFIVPSDILTVFLLVLHIFLFIIATLARMGMLKIALKLNDDEPVRVKDLFSCYPVLFRYFLGTLYYWLIVLGGLVLLVVPGVIWAIRYRFYGFFVVDEGVGPIDSLRKSAEITRGSIWDLFLFTLLLTGVLLLGVLCLGVVSSRPTPPPWLRRDSSTAG